MILDRSLKDRTYYYKQKRENRLITIERLVEGGFFQNNRQMIVSLHWPSLPRLLPVLHSMNNLEKLSLLEWKLTLTQDVPQLLRSCPNLTELRIKLVERQKVEIGEELENELRPRFERLRLFELEWDMDSWLVIQEMFT